MKVLKIGSKKCFDMALNFYLAQKIAQWWLFAYVCIKFSGECRFPKLIHRKYTHTQIDIHIYIYIRSCAHIMIMRVEECGGGGVKVQPFVFWSTEWKLYMIFVHCLIVFEFIYILILVNLSIQCGMG